MSFKLEELPWLRPAPEGFRTAVQRLEAAESVSGAQVRALADHALDLNQSIRFAKALGGLRDRIVADGSFSPLRLAVLDPTTSDYIVAAVEVAAARHGVLCTARATGYGQVLQEVLDPNSALAEFGADAALIACDFRSLGLSEPSVYGRADALEEATETFRTLATSLGRLGITPILQTVPAPPDPWCGHYDRRAAGSVRAQVEAVNRSIVDLAAELACPLLDCAELAARVGTTRWFDHTQWHAAKLPFALELTPLYADHVARILGAMCGRGRKALVLDLDNTLWGGVVGDDGLEGIVLGQGSGEGEAFLAVQRYALELKRRGVVLAVCSKNDEHAARAPFHRHPEMLLSEEDIAVFSANWRDKAANLRDIAAALNIGTDALVLMDDNPREREQVRQALPEAAVPELPDDPAWYAAAVAQAGYFETLGLTAEDAVRAEQYRANACRARALQSEGDLDAFHRSLGMHCTIRRFDALSRSRIAQLINKTNQFNLTTRRYTEADVAAIEADPSKYELQVRLSDRFGDNGMISVIVFDISGEEWVCDTWLMSCRVIGRRVEELVLDVIAAAAREAGARRLLGDYIPTAKNRLVETFWPRMGFVEQGRLPGGGSRWVLNLDQHLAHDPPITLAFEDGRGALAGLEGQRRPPSASPADAGR